MTENNTRISQKFSRIDSKSDKICLLIDKMVNLKLELCSSKVYSLFKVNFDSDIHKRS